MDCWLTASMLSRYMHCPNLTIIDTPGFIMKVRARDLASPCAYAKSTNQMLFLAAVLAD